MVDIMKKCAPKPSKGASASQPPSDTCHGLPHHNLAEHQHACEEMIALRKRGTPAHMEVRVDANGEHFEAVRDDDPGHPKRVS